MNPNDVAKMKCVIVLRCFAKAAPKVIQSELESRADDLRVDVFVCQVLTMLLELVGVSVPSSWKSKAFNDQDIVYASAGESLTAADDNILGWVCRRRAHGALLAQNDINNNLGRTEELAPQRAAIDAERRVKISRAGGPHAKRRDRACPGRIAT